MKMLKGGVPGMAARAIFLLGRGRTMSAEFPSDYTNCTTSGRYWSSKKLVKGIEVCLPCVIPRAGFLQGKIKQSQKNACRIGQSTRCLVGISQYKRPTK